MIIKYFLRPGGVAALITTKGTMDKASPEVRKYLAERADLLGAIRLPNTAFKANAGTEVSADILFFQKRDSMTKEMPEWVNLGSDTNGITVNQYFADHPEMILGEMKEVSGPYGMETTCMPIEGADLELQLAEAVKNIHGSMVSAVDVETELDEMDIGNGHGGIVSQLKYDNEMKLTDEYWINYQKGKGSEEFQKYMEDLTDMQNHVLPYLQSFCNLEEKGVKERREQQIAERYEGRADERVTSTEANEVVKDVGKTDRKPAQQKQAVDGKDKKLSIHERLEINKRIIQEKQGKDKTERGVDLGVRTV